MEEENLPEETSETIEVKNGKRTLIIVGPGGIGKSPLDKLLHPDVIRIEPYRHRENPRDAEDVLYAPKSLRTQLEKVLLQSGDIPEERKVDVDNGKLETVLLFPINRVLMFPVRDEEQTLILPESANHGHYKMEIYAPVLPELLKIPDVTDMMGEITVMVLNPSETSLTAENPPYDDIAERTKINCKLRGDKKKSIKKRKDSVKEEAPFWRELLLHGGNYKAIEFSGWDFPEWKYKGAEKINKNVLELLRNEVKKILRAKFEEAGLNFLDFFEPEIEINGIWDKIQFALDI
jgi:hypothetical protein